MVSEELKLLLVEDDRDFAELMRQQLIHLACPALAPRPAITTVETLAAALAQLRATAFDAVLLDLALPDAKDLEAVEAIQAQSDGLAVIVLTASRGSRLIQAALNLGAEDYLVKGDFTPETLARAIRYAVDRRRARRALVVSERRFRALIEKASDAVFVLDDERIVTYASPATLTLLGRRDEEVLGKPIDDFIHSDDCASLRLEDGWTTTLLDLGGRRCEVRADDGHGMWRLLSASITDLRHDPAICGVVVNAQDVTEQRAAEEAMHRAQRLESAGLLAGGVAHDFNNLLTTIAAQHALALVKLSADSPARRHITNATRTIDMAARLTRQLLDYAGRGAMTVEAVHVNELAGDYARLMATTLSNDIDLRLDLDPAVTTIDMDPTQVQQIILNLVLNAADAIGDTEGEICIATRYRQLTDADLADYPLGDAQVAGRYVELVVSDTGQGMDHATLHQIFEPFFTTKSHGHGLGLAALLGIVRTNHGAIRVVSRPGEGSEFAIVFPVGRLALRQPRSASAADLRNRIGTVLVIEDEPRLREGIQGILAAAGLSSLSAEHGRQGLDLFRKNRDEIGAIYLDLRMPVMNGWEALEQLRAIDPDVEVLLSSAYYDAGELRDLTQDRHTTFVAKPFDMDRVIMHLADAVGRRFNRRTVH